MDMFLELLKLGFVGLVAALFTSYLGNHDYRHRKWWELQASTYQKTIESLSDLVYYYETHFQYAMENRDMNTEFEKKVGEYWDAGFHQVRKAADSGAFLFSPQANAALKQFMSKEDDEEYYPMIIEIRLSKARTCLAQLVECSKIDLRLTSTVLERVGLR